MSDPIVVKGQAHVTIGYDGLDLATTAGAPPGSGANFAALKSRLAARGAKNPGALAAYIGRRKYGKKGMAKLSAKGRSHSHSMSGMSGILLAEDYRRRPGENVQCPSCGAYNEPDAKFCDQCGTELPDSDGDEGMNGGSAALRTPAPSGWAGKTGYQGQSTTVRSLSNPVELATGPGPADLMRAALGIAPRTPGRPTRPARPADRVTSPYDVHVSRGENGKAVLVHRRSGAKIGEIGRTADGRWAGKVGEQELPGHTQQRAAIMDTVSRYNAGISPGAGGQPLRPPAQQTPLMAQFGIPAVSAYSSVGQPALELAATAASASDGPRMTVASGDGGLSPRGRSIYAKLRKRGFPAARAMKFAQHAQNFGKGT